MTLQKITRSESYSLVEVIEYLPNAVTHKILIKKTTGNATITSLDSFAIPEQKKLPYDNYIQVIGGSVDLIIGKTVSRLWSGEGIIIPAHVGFMLKPDHHCKIISTVKTICND